MWSDGLRQYQVDAIKALWQWWKENPDGHPLIIAPTGSGKSLKISAIVKRLLEKRPEYNVLIVSHRKEIIEQNTRKLQAAMPDRIIGVYSAGLKIKRVSRVTVANIQSIVRCKSLHEIHLLIVDECHLLPNKSDSMYQKLISNLRSKNKYLKIVGLTATPYRLDQGHLIGEGSIFTDVAFDIEIPGLIKDGHLSNIRSKVSKEQVNLAGIKTVGFDYDQKELAERFDSLTIKHCQEIIKLGQNRKSWIIFCTGISHAEHVSSCLKEMGIEADYISGEMMSMERDRKINEFKAGKIKALCNCDILTTGFDYPELDFLVLLRATKSTALYVQMVGRCMRPAKDKADALVLDFGGNIFRHGPIDSISVSKKTKNGKAEIKKAPVKDCPSCGDVVAIRTLECACGYQFPLDTTKLTVKPDTQASILSEPETLDVTWHNYRLHKKPGKPPSFKIEYGCGSRLFYDFFCFDHGGYATEMARKKWKVLFNMAPPVDVTHALSLSSDLPVPQTVVVKKVGDFWRVLEVVSIPKDKAFNPVEEIGINI